MVNLTPIPMEKIFAPFRLLVTGSRDWPEDDGGAMTVAFDGIVTALGPDVPITLVHGACPTGADALAEKQARARGWDIERHPADWETLGKRAGFVRNQLMVDIGAHLCLAFLNVCTKPEHARQPPHPSHGADHCSSRAEKANIATSRILRGC